MSAAIETVSLSGRERLIIALVALAHGSSHFFQLVLPPLFLFLVDEFEVGYTALGAVMTLFFVVSGCGQPLAGFLVDRFGARRLLLFGLGIYVVAVVALAAVNAFWMFYVVMAIAALGNCVFHPADYTVLAASVPQSHMGRAFSIHTLGGNIGWAVAPALMLLVAGFAGWRVALYTAGMIGALVWLALWINRDLLRDETPSNDGDTHRPLMNATVLFSPSVVLCFAYFTLLSAGLIAVQNFIAPILTAVHAMPLALAGAALTAFLLGASAGVVAGGIAADRSSHHAGIIAGGLAGCAILIVGIAYAPAVAAVLIVMLAFAGFLSGMTSPSRDLLVRAAAPPGATGRVFGFVYSGLDVGSAFAPVSVGLMLDHGHPRAAIWAIAAMFLFSIFTVVAIRRRAPGVVAA